MDKKTKITQCTPSIRFLDQVSYTISRGFTKTYDCRLIYVLDGAGSIYVKDKEYQIKAGLFVTFQAGTLYRITPKPSFKAIVADFDFTDEYKERVAVYSPIPKDEFNASKMHQNVTFEDAPAFNQPIVEYNSFYLEVSLYELVKEFNGKRAYYKERSSNLLKNLFLEVLRNQLYEEKPMQLAVSIVEYVHENYAGDISNKTLSKIFNYDGCYLNRIIKKYTGLSLHAFVLKHRVDMGIKLLLTTDYTLEIIAEKTGFHSAPHFLKRCKEITGHLPSHYRKK